MRRFGFPSYCVGKMASCGYFFIVQRDESSTSDALREGGGIYRGTRYDAFTLLGPFCGIIILSKTDKGLLMDAKDAYTEHIETTIKDLTDQAEKSRCLVMLYIVIKRRYRC